MSEEREPGGYKPGPRYSRRQVLALAAFAGAHVLSYDRAFDPNYKPKGESVFPAVNDLPAEYGYLRRLTDRDYMVKKLGGALMIVGVYQFVQHLRERS